MQRGDTVELVENVTEYPRFSKKRVTLVAGTQFLVMASPGADGRVRVRDDLGDEWHLPAASLLVVRAVPQPVKPASEGRTSSPGPGRRVYPVRTHSNRFRRTGG